MLENTVDQLTIAPLIASFKSFGRADVALAGGKGANLGELVRAGLPVPAGFVITTRAYADTMKATGVDQQIAEALGQINLSTPETVLAASQAIEQAFVAAPFPAEVARAVIAAYRQLGAGPVAVRSSATAEDLADAAFAGQQDTFLNVIGENVLLDSIRRCWASLWSERAIHYRAHRDVDHARVKMAVVVQRMVLAEVAGVLFTANPVTGARDEIAIDASPGLGEAVVAGLVTPEHIVLDKRTKTVVERRAGSQDVVVRPLPNGGTELIRTESESGTDTISSGKLCLSDAMIAELARLAIVVDQHFGAPQDVEWAWADGAVALLQARPITTSAPSAPPRVAASVGKSPPARTKNQPSRFVAGLLGELFPIRPYPLDVSTYTRVLLEALCATMFAPLGLRCLPPEEELVEKEGVIVGIGFGPRPTVGLIYRPWLTLWRNRRFDLHHWQDDPIIPEAIRRARELQGRDLPLLSWEDLLRTLQAALGTTPFVTGLRRRYFPQAIRDTLVLWLLLALTGRRRDFNLLLTGVETKTLEMNRTLESLAIQVGANPDLRSLFERTSSHALLSTLEADPAASAFLAAFRAFLDRYGNRETVITLASQPTWRNAPNVPLGVIKSMIAEEASVRDAGETIGRSFEPTTWQQVRDQILAHSILGKGPLRPLFEQVLEGARRFPQLREDTRFYLTLGLPVVHAVFQELGRRLSAVGATEQPDDVLHLKLDELESLGQSWPPNAEALSRIQILVARRKAKRAEADELGWLDDAMPSPLANDAGAILAGLPGSAGIAEGPVRMIRNASQFGELRPGDVLVAPYTSPAWTPLFRRAAAVVVDTGGPLSHAAIVAREYRLPAVLGTVHGTRRLRDGQRVRVDGARGLVFLIQ